MRKVLEAVAVGNLGWLNFLRRVTEILAWRSEQRKGERW